MKILTVFLCLWLVVPPQLYAAGVVPDGGAPASNQPAIVAAPNGLPVVNIVAATPQGVSHNKYRDFNVNAEGLILNNSSILSHTELAGYVLGNPNLAGAAARVILNEVTSTSRSHLNGYTEVAGQEADVIIANPNGISVNGAGFLNTPRVTLTTGSPVLAGGKVDYFLVQGGNIGVDGAGLSVGSVDQYDLITRALQVNAGLHANDLNVILGRNRVDAEYLDTELLSSLDTKPEFSLDVSQLGGMYADRIRLVGTEAGVGVRIAGDMAASVGDIVISNSGRIELAGHVAADGDVRATAWDNIVVTGKAVAGNILDIENKGFSVINGGEMISGESLRISSSKLNNTGLIASAGSAEFSISENIVNRQGMMFSIGDLSVNGPNVAGAGLTLLNDGGIIETWDGDININAAQVINRSEEPVVVGRWYTTESGWYQIGTWRYNDIESGYIQSIVPTDAPTASIVSGGDLNINSDVVNNNYSLISASGDLKLSGRLLTNIGREAIHWWSTSQKRLHWYKKHHTAHHGCKTAWYGMPTLYFGFKNEIADAVYGTLEAGGSLVADFHEQIDNGKQFVGVLTAEKSMMPIGLQSLPGAENDANPVWEMLFQQAPESQPYLIETRSEFAQMNSFVNSGYLLGKLDYNPDQNVKRLGDGQYELRLLRDDVVEETGRRYLSEDYDDEKEQFLALMDNAVEIAPELELEVGMALKSEQVEMLTNDIVWLVEEEVSGQKVLVPQLYLARVHDENILQGSQIVADGDLALFSDGAINNAGRIAARGDVEMRTGGDVAIHQGTVDAGQNLQVESQGSVNIAGGKVRGGEVSIEAEDISLQTIAEKNENSWGHNTMVGQAAVVEAEEGLELRSGGDILVHGASVTGGQIEIDAKETLVIDAVEDSFRSEAKFKGGYEIIETVRQQGSEFSGESVSFSAGDDIVVIASSIAAESNLDVSAGDSVEILSAEERDYREFKMKQSSGLGSKTEFSREESIRQVGSQLEAGGNLLVSAGNNAKQDNAGNVGILASRLASEEDIYIAATGQVDVGAMEESEFSESYVKKSNAIRKKESINNNDKTTLKQADLSAGGNLVVRSEDDINLVAADVRAGEMIYLSAGDDGSGNLNMMADNEVTETLKYTRRSGIDLSISEDFASIASDKRHTYGTRREQTVSTELSAGEIYLNAGTDVNMIGAAADAGGDLVVQAGRDVNVMNAVKSENDYEKHQEKKIGFSVDIDQDSAEVFAGVQEKKDILAEDSQISYASHLNAGNDLIVVAGNDLNQVGSDIYAGRDVILEADGSIRSLASADTNSLYEYHEQLRVGFTAGVQHNIGSAIDAVENIDDSGNLLTGASRTLKAVDAVNNATQPSFSAHFGVTGSKSELESVQSASRVSTIVAGRDVAVRAERDVEMEGTVVAAGEDIELSAENVRLLAAVNRSTASERSKNYQVGVTVQGSGGFGREGSGSFSGGVSGSKSKYGEASTASTPVLLQAGQDVEIEARHDIEMEGTQASTGGDMHLAAGGNLEIRAAQGEFSSNFKSGNFGASGGITASASGQVGLYVSANGGQSRLIRDNSQSTNANLLVGGDLDIRIGGDAAIYGANLDAENVRADVAGDLHLASVRDAGSVDGERWSAGVTVGVGTASGVSGSYGETDGKKDWIDRQASIVARNEIDINVGDHTQLEAALIASESGNLRLETETFSYSDHYGVDQEESFDIGFGLNGIGGGPANQQSGAGANDSDANWSIDGGYSNRDRRQTVRATIGDGAIVVRADNESETDSTAGLNRDVEKAYEITKDESDSYEVYASENAIDSAENYDETLANWGHVALNYGRATVAAVKSVDYITEKVGAAELIMDAVDAIEFLPLGIMPGRGNYGGWVTQIPVLLSGDMEFYKVVAFLEKVEKTGQLELIKDTLQVDEINIHDPEQLKAVLKIVDYASVNGVNNSLELAIRNGAMQTGETNFIQEYNPTHGLIGDAVECLWDYSIGGIIKSGNARNINEFYSLVDQSGESLKVASHSQGALLNYRALDGLEFGKDDWTFQFFGAPVQHERLNEAVKEAKGISKGSYANYSREEIGGGLAYKNDFVSSILGGNAESVQEIWNGLASFPSVMGVSRSDHSNYVCQGDFCAGQQSALDGYVNSNTMLLQ